MSIRLFSHMVNSTADVSGLNSRGARPYSRIGMELHEGDIVKVCPPYVSIPGEQRGPKVQTASGEDKELFNPNRWIYGVCTYVNTDARWATVDLGQYRRAFDFAAITPTGVKAQSLVLIERSVYNRNCLAAGINLHYFHQHIDACVEVYDNLAELQEIIQKFTHHDTVYRLCIISDTYPNDFAPWCCARGAVTKDTGLMDYVKKQLDSAKVYSDIYLGCRPGILAAVG